MKTNKDETTITITRKYAIIPTSSDMKEWNKKIYKFTVDKLEKKIESLKEELRWLRINKPDQTGKARQGIFKIKFMILNVK